MLTKQIEKAQKKVEEQNFLIRKRVLEYDDVMNEQRRDRLRLPRRGARGPRHGRAGARGDRRRRSAASSTSTPPGDYVEDWDLDGLFAALADIFPVELRAATERRPRAALDREELDRAARRGRAARSTTSARSELGDELMRALERYLLLQIIDQRWREHLYDMDYLREGIHLRGFAQIDPLVAYKNEAFELFSDLMNTIWSDFARMIFHVEVEVEGDGRRCRTPPPSYAPGGSPTAGGSVSYSGGGGTDAAQRAGAAAAGAGRQARAGGGRADEGGLRPAVEQRQLDERRADRAQRPVLVRLGQEVQEVPRGQRMSRRGRPGV